MEVQAGRLISSTFSIFFRNFVPFTIVAFLVNLPSMLIGIWAVWTLSLDDLSNWESQLKIAERFDQFTNFIFSGLASGTITYGVIQQLRGHHAGLGQCLSVGFSSLPRIMGISILTGLATALGMLLLLIPGLIVMTMLATAPVVGVVEREGVMASLRRSSDLSQGHRMQIFLTFLVLGLILVVPAFAIGFMAVRPGTTPEEILGTLKTMQVIQNAMAILTGGLFATAPAVIYHALRTAKEGVDTEEIARVFD